MENNEINNLIGKNKIIDISTKELFDVLSSKVLFEARWGFSKGNLTDEEYKSIIENKAKPALEKLKKQEETSPLIECKAVYAYFEAKSEGNKIIINNCEFEFPRQEKEPYLCIADFIKNNTSKIIPFFVVTIGSKIIEAEKKLFEENAYYDYHLLHGLGAEMADCAAVCVHRKICCELFKETYDKKDKPLGCRYSFGYPSCPDLAYQKKLFELLNPSRIGVTLTESYQMVPEFSVSGFILFNNKARYFVP